MLLPSTLTTPPPTRKAAAAGILPTGVKWPALNPKDQLPAVTAPLCPQLVSAGPGTGKTRVLACRAAYLLTRYGEVIRPSHLAVVTFTTKAAQELKRRLVDLVGRRAQHVRTGTLHHFCYEILREDPARAGFPGGFVVASDAITDAFWQSWHEANKAWCKSRGLYRFKDVKLRISRVKLGLDTISGHLVNGLKAYNAMLRRRDALDYDDLLTRARDLLASDAQALGALRSSLRALLVDEFQDTDGVQYAIVKQIVGNGTLRLLEQGGRGAAQGCHVFCVADDDQSIYSFRGARPKNVRDYAEHFGCTRQSGSLHVLGTNYRSNRAIFAVAEHVLGSGGARIKRRGEVETSDRGHRPVKLARFADEAAEMRFAAERVATWQREGVPLERMAVLAPWNSMVRQLEATFLRAGVPCETSSDVALLDTPLVQRVQAALRFVVQACKETPDAGALSDALGDLMRLVLEDETYARFTEFAQRQGTRLWDTFQALAGGEAEARGMEAHGFDTRDHAQLDWLYATIRNLVESARAGGKTVGGFAEEVARTLGSEAELLGPEAPLADPLSAPGLAEAAKALREATRRGGRVLLFDAEPLASGASRGGGGGARNNSSTPHRIRLWRLLAGRALAPNAPATDADASGKDAPGADPYGASTRPRTAREDGRAVAVCWVGPSAYTASEGGPLAAGDVVLTSDADAFARWAARRGVLHNGVFHNGGLHNGGLHSGAFYNSGDAPTVVHLSAGAEGDAADVSGDSPVLPIHAPGWGPSRTLFKLLQAATTPAAPEPLLPTYVMVDLETTGLDVHACQVVEIAAVRVEGGIPTASFQTLVGLQKPPSPEEARTLRDVCGLNPETDFGDALPLKEAWRRFCAFVRASGDEGDTPLVAHNGQGFDFRILQRLKTTYADDVEARWGLTYDTLPLAARLLPGEGKHTAEALRERLLGDAAPTTHRALADCRDQQRLLEVLLAERARQVRVAALEPLLPALLAALLYERQHGLVPEPPQDADAQALVDAAYRWSLRDASPARDALRRLLPRPLPELVRADRALYSLVDEDRLAREEGVRPGLKGRLQALLAPYAHLIVGDGGLEHVLSQLALWGGDEGGSGERRVVTLSTCHSAKGLEFERVILMGARDGAFPDFRDKTEEDVQERRRLLYVGLTRAEQHLVVTCAERKHPGSPFTSSPTPFLNGVPSNLVEEIKT